jgi:hypothetical protein
VLGPPKAANFLRFRPWGLVEAERSGIPRSEHYLLRAVKGWTLADLESAAGLPSLRGLSEDVTAVGFGLRGNGTGRGAEAQRRSATGISTVRRGRS